MNTFTDWTREGLEQFACRAVDQLIQQDAEILALRTQLAIAMGKQRHDASAITADAIRKAAAK